MHEGFLNNKTAFASCKAQNNRLGARNPEFTVKIETLRMEMRFFK